MQDPIVHHDVSQYSAFDNNPIYWADPSGADATYNWDNGKYYDNGREVGWNQVQKQYGIGNYANTTSVMLAPEFEDNGYTVKNDYGTGALANIINSATKTNTNIRVLHVKDEEDAANQMENITSYINNLFILSHGDSKSEDGHHAYSAIGNTIFNKATGIINSDFLTRIATVLSTKRGIFMNGSCAEVLIFACGAGGTYNGGVELMKSLSQKLHSVVYGNQSLTACSNNAFEGGSLSFSSSNWPSGHDQNGSYSSSYKNVGNWTKVTPFGNTSFVETVKNVRLDSFGNIHYN